MTRYRYPRSMRYYRRGSTPLAGKAVLAVIVAAALAGASHTVTARAGTHHHHHGSPARSAAATQVLRYERARLGLPYCWGGTGPSCYDCSGLAMEAYASAGVTIPRTTEAEWADLPHVPASQRRTGDLVLAPGADGTMASPGHVGTLIGRNTVIQAYATGTPIEVSSLTDFGAAAGGIVGFARPGGA
jgi:cell wall-associated NlpC family hydrolase